MCLKVTHGTEVEAAQPESTLWVSCSFMGLAPPFFRWKPFVRRSTMNPTEQHRALGSVGRHKMKSYCTVLPLLYLVGVAVRLNSMLRHEVGSPITPMYTFPRHTKLVIHQLLSFLILDRLKENDFNNSSQFFIFIRVKKTLINA